MAQDQQQTTEGVSAPAAPASTPAAAEIASAQPAAATPSSPEPATQQAGTLRDEDFRKFQSEADRRYQQLQQQFQQTQQQFQQQRDLLRAQAEENERLRLANASDDEQAKYYKAQRDDILRKQAENERAQAEYNYWNGIAYTVLQEAGIKPDDPRLSPYLAAGATPQGIAQLSLGIAKIARADAEQARAEAAKASKRGAIEALNEAGVTATSNGTGDGGASVQSAARKAYSDRLAALKQRAQNGSPASPAEWAELQKMKRAAEST